MGIIFDMASFYRWLSEELDVQLLKRAQDLREILPKLEDEEVVSETKKWLRIIEQELVARKLR